MTITRSVLRLTLALTLFCVITPAASAGTRFVPEYDDAPDSICGPIDPNVPCYLPLGSGDCPPNTSYNNCLARCECQKKAAYKKCEENNGGLSCKSAADMNERACKGECLSDWTP